MISYKPGSTGGGGAASDLLSVLVSTPVSVTGTTALSSSAFGKLHVCSGTSANYTVTLPDPASSAGKLIGFRMAPGLTRLVTIAQHASELIDGAASRVLWASETALLLSDGTNWFKLAGRSIPMKCTMRLAANQGSIATSTMTKVLIDTVDDDPTAAMADTTNKRINIVRPASYQPTGNVIWSALSANSFRTITNVTKNVGIIVLANGESYGQSSTYPSVLAVVASVALAAGDYVELRGFHNSGATESFYGNTSPNSSTSLGLVEQPSW